MFGGDPSNKEVREYGQNLGDVLISFAGSAKALNLISKVAPSLTKLLNKAKVKVVLNRPYIRIEVRKEVERRAPKTSDGRFIDPNTGKPIEGKYDLGHKPEHEFWREKEKAEKEGLTQKEFNDRMNNPDLYQIETLRQTEAINTKCQNNN